MRISLNSYSKRYDKYIVAFSGGKDSTALVLHLLDLGIAKDKIELWHHDIDGGNGDHFMDWPITKAYCQSFADALGIQIYFSWKVGGFLCIFGNADQFKTGHLIDPEGLERIGTLEDGFGITIKRDKSVWALLQAGEAYKAAVDSPTYRDLAMSTDYVPTIIMDQWELPPGAYGKSCGPS